MSFYSRIIDLQKLNIAWERVKKNKPACGVDNVTWEIFEEDRKEQLKQLNICLANHEYTSMPVRMVALRQEEKVRNVAIYCMRDKVLQQSVASELVKIYDGLFSDFLGYYFNKRGKTIPARAESGLFERLESIWLTEKTKNLQDKLKKGAEILEGLEQYFREDRNIASAYEFAVVVYMTQNKKIDITILEKCRKTFSNINHEICQYLSQFWKRMNHCQMILYEMEDFYGVVNLDQGVEINSDYLGELLAFYEELLIEETEELLENIMQIYSDSGSFNKAAIFMDKIVQLSSSNEIRDQLPVIKPLEAYAENEERENLNFTEIQIKRYMDNFVGREDMYTVQGVDRNGRQNYVQVMEPLTEDILKRHFKGECTVGTYVQRNNGTSHYMVIDIDISKKVLLESEKDGGKRKNYIQEAANFAQRIQKELKKMGLCGWIEESGYRGYHIWILFTDWISVRYVNMLQDIIEGHLDKIPESITLEFFPNKSKLKRGKLGQVVTVQTPLPRSQNCALCNFARLACAKTHSFRVLCAFS